MGSTSRGFLRGAVAALAVLSIAALGVTVALPTADAQEAGEPFFSVSPIEPPDHMWGAGWLPESEVQINVDDPAVGGAVDFTTTIPTDADGYFEVFDLPFDIQAGQIATVSQQGFSVKTHDVIDLTISEVDPVAETVSGVGGADTLTYVNFPGGQVVVTSDGTGEWTADLGSAGFDIVPGTTIYAFQADEDWDQTQIDFHLPEPFFSVSPIEPPDHMWGAGWLPESEVQINVDDPAVGGAVDFTTTIPTDADGYFEVFDLPFDIQAGQIATVSQQGFSVKTHDVIDLTISEVDPVAETVSGVGGADTLTYVNFPGGQVVVTSDGTGEWTADLGSAGFDIVPGTTIYAFQADEDWDQTQIDFHLPDGGYIFSGFADPVDSDAINLAKAGRTVPLKFLVTSSVGDPVTDLADVAVTVTALPCELGTTADQVEEYAAGNSGLQNLGDGYYQYNWKTPKSYKNSCKLMALDIGDGVPHTAQFHFTR